MHSNRNSSPWTRIDRPVPVQTGPNPYRSGKRPLPSVKLVHEKVSSFRFRPTVPCSESLSHGVMFSAPQCRLRFNRGLQIKKLNYDYLMPNLCKILFRQKSKRYMKLETFFLFRSLINSPGATKRNTAERFLFKVPFEMHEESRFWAFRTAQMSSIQALVQSKEHERWVW